MSSEDGWWKSFFTGMWLDAQKKARADRSEEEAEFIRSVLDLRPSARVLDVPCGDGRLSVQLALRGCKVTGVDINEQLLGAARDNAESLGLDIQFSRADMRRLEFDGDFDFAFCFWGSFGYFDGSGDVAFIKGLHDALRPAGRILIDVPNVAEGLLPRFQERSWWRAGDMLVLEEREYNYRRSRIEVTCTLIEGDRRQEARCWMRVYTYRELTELLSEAGFQSFEAYSSLAAEPFVLGGRLFLVAERAA